MENVRINLITFKSGMHNLQVNKYIETKNLKVDYLLPEKSDLLLHDNDFAKEFTKIYANANKSITIITFNSAIMNALRIAYKKKLNSKVSKVNFTIVDKDFNETKIKVNKDGSLSDWPEDFFDIWKKQLGEIIA